MIPHQSERPQSEPSQTSRSKASPKASRLVVILIAPQLAANTGLSARAMYNFGLTDLRLVRPRHSPKQARNASAGAAPVIDAAQVFDTLADASHDLHTLWACTARSRRLHKPVVALPDLPDALAHEPGRHGLVFGGEKAGLDNADVAACSHILHIPTSPDCPSLNLAHAVLLAAHYCARYGARRPARDLAKHDAPEILPAPRQTLDHFLTRLIQTLDEDGFFFPPEKRDRMIANLRGIFTRIAPSQPEIDTLHGIISIRRRPKPKKTNS
ncbi:MAG: TrmH family RNA methyltransferase [Pseudomonadota bacterium]